MESSLILIKDYRIKLGLSQAGMAKELKVSRATINRWEGGKNDSKINQFGTLKALLENGDSLEFSCISLREYRKKSNKSQAEVARELGLSRATINRLENGKSDRKINLFIMLGNLIVDCTKIESSHKRGSEKIVSGRGPYNKSTKWKRRKNSRFANAKEEVRLTFNRSDIMISPVEKTLRILEKIISGEKLFSM